jgi:hypothetical protein
MQIQLSEISGVPLAEIISADLIFNDVQDVLDIMADCRYNGAHAMIIHENQIVPDFFDLKTGIAGEILQKFSNYDMRLAIVGDFTKYTSKSLRDFIYESNKGRRINFVSSLDEAKQCLGYIK